MFFGYCMTPAVVSAVCFSGFRTQKWKNDAEPENRPLLFKFWQVQQTEQRLYGAEITKGATLISRN